MIDLLPTDGFNAGWLKDLYFSHVRRSRAVGKDGVRPLAFEAVIDAECELITAKVNSGTYRFTNYREKLIARGANRAPRQISIPTIRDRLALRGALQFLKFHFPSAQPRPPHIYIKDIKEHLKIAREHSSFLRMDIRDFYPSIRHDLIETILKDSGVPEEITLLILAAAATGTGSKAQPRPKCGVPQGLSISNALSSIYMIEFDKSAEGVTFFRRYVDDILIIDHSEKIKDIYQKMSVKLSGIGLSSHKMGTIGKTEVRLLNEGVQYLGYEVKPSKIAVRESSLAKMFDNLSKVVTCFKYKNDIERHLFRMNLKITGCIINNSRRGWLMFFSQTDDISQLAYLDSWLRSQLSKHPIDISKLKEFKKSYYEIRFNLKATTYIPNFDKFDLDQKKGVVALLGRRSAVEVEVMAVEVIEREFNRLIGREVNELERDLVDAFS